MTAQPMTPRRIANFDTFLRRDFTAIAGASLRPADVAGAGLRIIPALGATTPPAVFDRRCAERLAALLDVPPVVLPGGHNGNTTHPRGYAEVLRDVLGGE